MGAVGIWSMHFIGNQSLTLWVNESAYQLSYKSGYTFASLVVAIACMFLAFAFVGISEKAQLSRIVPSGIFTGVRIYKKKNDKSRMLNTHPLWFCSLASSVCIMSVRQSDTTVCQKEGLI